MSINDLHQLFLSSAGVSTDSREITEQQIFFALQGDNFDGNQFADQAIERGAMLAVISDPSRSGDKYLCVDDVLSTLQELATYHRLTFDIPVLGITGSNGKTTTKELVGAVLAKRYNLHYTRGNLNNHIGVPLTLLSLRASCEFAVIEMGANHQGEIRDLCEIARPTHGLITNIGKAHLEGFGGLEGVKKGKSELYDFLARSGGTALVNDSELYLRELSDHVAHRVFYAMCNNPGFTHDSYCFRYTGKSEDGLMRFACQDQSGHVFNVESSLPGDYNKGNIATAIAVGMFFQVKPADIIEAVAEYRSIALRSQRLDIGRCRVLLDAYNANPTSMALAIENFQEETGPKMLLLGDMLELGADSYAEHRDILDLVNGFDWQKVILVGKEFGRLEKSFPAFHFVDHVEELEKLFQDIDLDGVSLLVKGSRAIALERALDLLQA